MTIGLFGYVLWHCMKAGLFEAARTLVEIVVAFLITLTFYEHLSYGLQKYLSFGSGYADITAFILLCGGGFFGLRQLGLYYIYPDQVQLSHMPDRIGGIAVGFLAAAMAGGVFAICMLQLPFVKASMADSKLILPFDQTAVTAYGAAARILRGSRKFESETFFEAGEIRARWRDARRIAAEKTDEKRVKSNKADWDGAVKELERFIDEQTGRVAKPFAAADIQDWPGLSKKLARDGKRLAPNPGRRVWQALPPAAQQMISNAAQSGRLSTEAETEILAALNIALKNRGFYLKDHFADLSIPGEAKALLEIGEAARTSKEVIRVNRLLLEAAYSDEIAKSAEAKRQPVPQLVHEARELLKDVKALADKQFAGRLTDGRGDFERGAFDLAAGKFGRVADDFKGEWARRAGEWRDVSQALHQFRTSRQSGDYPEARKASDEFREKYPNSEHIARLDKELRGLGPGVDEHLQQVRESAERMLRQRAYSDALKAYDEFIAKWEDRPVGKARVAEAKGRRTQIQARIQRLQTLGVDRKEDLRRLDDQIRRYEFTRAEQEANRLAQKYQGTLPEWEAEIRRRLGDCRKLGQVMGRLEEAINKATARGANPVPSPCEIKGPDEKIVRASKSNLTYRPKDSPHRTIVAWAEMQPDALRKILETFLPDTEKDDLDLFPK